MADAARQSLVPVRAGHLTKFGRELLAMTILFAVYKFGRIVHTSDVGLAYSNAQRIWDFERWSHLPNELDAQQAMLPFKGIVEFANTYYAFVHIPATAAFLIWMYLRRPELYPAVRRAIIAMTAIALIGHICFPLAPPRMLPNYGFVDTAALYGPNVYGDTGEAESFINQYAAMPSLHVGWAMLVAAGLIASFRTRWRWLFLLHPTITAVAVVGTANHYWIDGIIACFVLALAVYLFGDPAPIPWHKASPMRLVRARRARKAVGAQHTDGNNNGGDNDVDYYGILPPDVPDSPADGPTPQDCVTVARAAPGPPNS